MDGRSVLLGVIFGGNWIQLEVNGVVLGVLGGDFNIIKCSEDRVGGCRVSPDIDHIL